ncbi:MAG TPA: RIP metalloprotease RseP [bacterium (Candidatus Stahlbacteria)]|nr:RIP metalloprotease RseP [Candidatus Stahlbacteria bacterium]
MLLTVVAAIIGLSILIIFHELGHFVAAKKAGIKVHEFSLGFGPKIFSIKRGETLYKVCIILFGGYVRLAGMDPHERKGEPYEYGSKPIWKRAGVAFCGPAFNFVLAFVLFSFTILMYGIEVIDTRIVGEVKDIEEIRAGDEIIAIDGEGVKDWNDILNKIRNRDSVTCTVLRAGEVVETSFNPNKGNISPLILPVIGGVEKGGPASKAGLRDGDRILSVNDEPINSWDEFVSIIQANPEKELKLRWRRGDEEFENTCIPKKEQRFVSGEVKEVGVIGVSVKLNTRKVGINALRYGGYQTIGTIGTTLSFMAKLVKRQLSPKLIGGPVSIIRFMGESARWGSKQFLSFIAFLSIQLFIINLIPIPPLDGGQLTLLGIEKIRRRAISEKEIVATQTIGFALLMLFFLYVTFNDIMRLIK